jgi:hypothetical protein
MDELAKLRIRRNDKLYCIKVFETTIRIEQDLGGDNVSVNQRNFPVYDVSASAWDFQGLGRLIDMYQARKLREQLETWSDEGGAPAPSQTT